MSMVPRRTKRLTVDEAKEHLTSFLANESITNELLSDVLFQLQTVSDSLTTDLEGDLTINPQSSQ